MLVVGCSHPGIDKIVEAAATINPNIHLIAGGFHLVAASDDAIAKIGGRAEGYFQSRNHRARALYGRADVCGVEEGFRRPIFLCRSRHYLSAWSERGSDTRRGEGPALQQDNLTTYRRPADAKIRSVSYMREAYGPMPRSSEDACRPRLFVFPGDFAAEPYVGMSAACPVSG